MNKPTQVGQAVRRFVQIVRASQSDDMLGCWNSAPAAGAEPVISTGYIRRDRQQSAGRQAVITSIAPHIPDASGMPLRRCHAAFGERGPGCDADVRTTRVDGESLR
jgi:hypothetical protein